MIDSIEDIETKDITLSIFMLKRHYSAEEAAGTTCKLMISLSIPYTRVVLKVTANYNGESVVIDYRTAEHYLGRLSVEYSRYWILSKYKFGVKKEMNITHNIKLLEFLDSDFTLSEEVRDKIIVEIKNELINKNKKVEVE